MTADANLKRRHREALDEEPAMPAHTPRSETAAVGIGLNAAIVAVIDDEPVVLVVRDEGDGATEGLPFGPFSPVEHRTLEGGLRSWVAEQTGLDLGYVEQLYTFGDRGRHAEPGDVSPHIVSIGYLALTEASHAHDIQRGTWRSWYHYFPWEDWRKGRPELLDGRDRAAPQGMGRAPGAAHLACAPREARGPHSHLLRPRRRDVGRGEGARPLRAALRSGSRRRSAPRRARSRTCLVAPAALRHADALRSPPHPRHRDRTRARQDQIPPRDLRADAATTSRSTSCRRPSRRFSDRICTSRTSAASSKARVLSSRRARSRRRPADVLPSSSASAARSCSSGRRRAFASSRVAAETASSLRRGIATCGADFDAGEPDAPAEKFCDSSGKFEGYRLNYVRARYARNRAKRADIDRRSRRFFSGSTYTRHEYM